MEKVLDDVQSVAISRIIETGLSEENDRKILIQGEPGTGKNFYRCFCHFLN
ncbi:hypothetical protein OL548_34145 (plasmid) [Lysinibacillus sp. MHQ-1]|nr:hypothetical protein OL548_34145 [Lysinibacillus sp. MHQ-1]